MLAASGVACALLSGRRSAAVALRAAELGIAHVLQGVDDKHAEFERCSRGSGLVPRKPASWATTCSTCRC